MTLNRMFRSRMGIAFTPRRILYLLPVPSHRAGPRGRETRTIKRQHYLYSHPRLALRWNSVTVARGFRSGIDKLIAGSVNFFLILAVPKR